MDVICLIQICSNYRKAKYDPTIEKPTNEYKKISQFRRYLPQVSNLNTLGLYANFDILYYS